MVVWMGGISRRDRGQRSCAFCVDEPWPTTTGLDFVRSNLMVMVIAIAKLPGIVAGSFPVGEEIIKPCFMGTWNR